MNGATALGFFLALAAPAAAFAAPDCAPAALALAPAAPAAPGATPGVVVRDRDAADCALPGLPELRFTDRAGRPVAAHRFVPPGLHPGPVVIPVVVSPTRAAILFVSATAADPAGRCRRAAAVSLVLRTGATASLPLALALCAPPGREASFIERPLRPLAP